MNGLPGQNRALPQARPMMGGNTFLQAWGQMNGAKPYAANRPAWGGGDRGGNTFLNAFAQMQGSQPVQAAQQPQYGNTRSLIAKMMLGR